MDKAQELAERRLKRVDKRLRDIYRAAIREMQEKLAEFTRRHEAMEKLNRQMVKDGKMTRREFEQWMRGQVFQGELWKAKIQQLSDVLYAADQNAQKIVDGTRAITFAESANYTGYEIESGLRTNINFTMYDVNTVQRMIRDNPHLLPKARMPKPKTYAWYSKVINNAVTQGILQGESLEKIAKRISAQSGEKSRSMLHRHARTAMTAAQNAGRVEGMQQAQKLGVNLQKRWIATLDSRTRDAHGYLDGQTANVDEPFNSILGPIMYPGDMEAAPGNFWNCRCSLGYAYPDYAQVLTRRDNETGEVFTGTYQDWVRMKKGG